MQQLNHDSSHPAINFNQGSPRNNNPPHNGDDEDQLFFSNFLCPQVQIHVIRCVSDFQFLHSNFCHETKNDTFSCIYGIFEHTSPFGVNSKWTFLFRKVFTIKSNQIEQLQKRNHVELNLKQIAKRNIYSEFGLCLGF